MPGLRERESYSVETERKGERKAGLSTSRTHKQGSRKMKKSIRKEENILWLGCHI